VCKGNICRSPFAENYTRQRLGDRIAVNSAGYYPHGDRQPPAAAIEAARRFGVDLGAHRSRIVGGAAVREAEVIFVFDEENRERLLRDWPSARRKVLLLATVLRSGPQEITDPYGQTEAVFAKTYSVIAEALDALLGNVPR
jgi:protein-tyrosine phosphatase